MAELFHTTVWSRIQEAQEGDEAAVTHFVDRYRPSVVRFIRGKGLSQQDAEDLAQEVFLRLLAQDALARADRERGRFRAFLAGLCGNVVREELRRRHRQKRGGGAQPVPLSEVADVADDRGSEDEFDTIWAEQLLARGLDALKVENPRQYRTLILHFREGRTQQEVAEVMGRNVQQVRNDLHRGRKRVVKLVRAEIVRYASSEAELEDELAMFASRIDLGE